MAPFYVWMRAAFAGLAVLVTWLTLTSNPESAESGFAFARLMAKWLFADAAQADKAAHFLAYGALGAFACWGRLRLKTLAWATPLALAAYGGGLELLQGLGGVREAELADAVANGLGVCAGYVAAYALSRMMALRTA